MPSRSIWWSETETPDQNLHFGEVLTFNISLETSEATHEHRKSSSCVITSAMQTKVKTQFTDPLRASFESMARAQQRMLYAFIHNLLFTLEWYKGRNFCWRLGNLV